MKIDISFWDNILEINMRQTVKTYPYLNTQIQISRIEVWVTNRSSQTQNVRNVIALQDLGNLILTKLN